MSGSTSPHSGLSVEARRLALSDAKYVLAHSDWRTPIERTLARAYLAALDEIEELTENLSSAEDHIDFIMGEIGGTLPR